MAPKALPPLGVLRQRLRYEPETGKLFWKEQPPSSFKDERAAKIWNGRYAGNEAGTKDPRGYIGIRINGHRVWAHRAVWAFVHGCWPEQHIDHLDGDKSNNRPGNLRECSNAVNSRNSKLFASNSSGVCGVCWDKKNGKWKAQAKVDGIQYNLGRFATKELAAAARKAFDAETGAFTLEHGVRQ